MAIDLVEALTQRIRDIVHEELKTLLGLSGQRMRGGEAPLVTIETNGLCHVQGCDKPYRAQGYCAAHYQRARKYGWPMPAPDNYVPPPTSTPLNQT